MRLVGLLLSVALIGGLMYMIITKGGSQPQDQPSAPKQTLDQVRDKTQKFEQQEQQRADDILRKTAQP